MYPNGCLEAARTSVNFSFIVTKVTLCLVWTELLEENYLKKLGLHAQSFIQ